MANYITENDIEQATLSMLREAPFNYDVIVCDESLSGEMDLNDGTFRADKKECILPAVLLKSLKKINPSISDSILEDVVRDLRRDFSATDMADTNYQLYNKIRNGIQVSFITSDNEEDFDNVKLIDFDNPENNTFTAVSQMWIQGKLKSRRPDILVFVNGLPLVFIELKNSIIKVQEAYNDNLQNYKKDIPNLFAFNQICVLSNGIETRLGAFNATYDFFFEWLKVNSEKDSINRERITSEGVSLQLFIKGLLRKDRLIDYIENFILFDNKSTKIIAKPHQYFGVNNLIESVKNREALKGRLGVFWHTQGSGKSYSMIMFERKVNRKIRGNFTFLIITDREDLDEQIHKNFVRTDVIGKKEECRPKNSKQLREYLQTNKPIIFTLIQKFVYDKGKRYPVLSKRNDIIVLVDEAHRTQYKDLAENMRIALPNANYIAFTGTPLLGSKRLTNQWFGDYVSEYNFAQSVEDGSTVPLFYSRRVPEVGLKNAYLDDDVLKIIEDEDLNEAETTLVENSASRTLEVIKRDDRLDKIARDIAYHFPRRGFLGKAMVISVDKFTTVKMYDKVSFYLEEEKKKLIQERNACEDDTKRAEITRSLDYLNNMEMAVVVSEENDEEYKFKQQDLDITKHRKRMNYIDVEGRDIEDQFKDPSNKLQLVFVCAMWLTGFDVKSLSTLYLDKPMKSHTLMQAIARANRVFPNKTCGLIVDYVNIFKYMERALGDYATGDNNVLPVKNIDILYTNLDQSIHNLDCFLKSVDLDIDVVIEKDSDFDRIDLLRQYYDAIVGLEDGKEKFKVLANMMVNLYEAAKPEIHNRVWDMTKFRVLSYLRALFYNIINDEKVMNAKKRIAEILDYSVIAEETKSDGSGLCIHEGKVIKLSQIDLSKLKKSFRDNPYKNLEIDQIKTFIEDALEQMINKNCNRLPFSERYRAILDRYNAGGTENEEYFDKLVEFMDELKKEQERPDQEGLTEEELEIYDLLIKGKKLTKAEEQKVKLAAKQLYQKLQAEKDQLLVVDWYKDEQPKTKVKSTIESVLDSALPESYDKVTFDTKSNLILSLFISKAVQGMAIV